MSLHLHESILLLSLDDEKGSFSMSGTYLYYGFAAALLLDLILGERIVVEEGRVSVIDKAITENRLLNDVLGRLKRFKKDRKVAYCIHYLVQRINKLRPQAIEHLIRQGILERREEKILWVFTVSRYPSANAEPEHTLRERLHSVAFHNAEPTPKERMLLSIILAGAALIREREHGTVEQRVFDGLRRMIEARKLVPAFADFDDRELVDARDDHLFVYVRRVPGRGSEAVLVAANFDVQERPLWLETLQARGLFRHGPPVDLLTGEAVAVHDGRLGVPPRGLLWLEER